MDEYRANGKKGSIKSVVKDILNQTQLPLEYILPGKTFPEALAKTTTRDVRRGVAIILLYDWMDDFDEEEIFKKEKQALLNLLTVQNTQDGINLNLASMTYSRIYLPQGGGIKLDKEQKKELAEINRARLATKGEQNDGNE